VGRILQAMTIEQSLFDHPTDTEIEMAISIELQTRTLDASTAETRRIELETVRSHPSSGDGPSGSQRRHHNHLHNGNLTSDL